MNELISVIINVYNGEKYIAKCLESVICQTYKNLEILIINDGSNDNTLKICKSYKDLRIKIINNKKNMGLSLSRNVGIDNAKGEYLYFIDSDDFITLDTIEYLYKLCIKYNTPMSSCMHKDIYGYDFIENNKNEKISVYSRIEILKKVLFSNDDRFIITCNKLIKKELFNNLRFENRIINDVAFTYKLVLKTDKVVYSNQIKYFYLKRKDSITGKRTVERSIDLYYAIIERYNYIKKIHPELIENEIGLITKIMMLYTDNKDKLQNFLKEQNAVNLARSLISIKVFIASICFKVKLKILLFKVSPKLYKYIALKYKRKHNKLTM